jgi:hypothetical protein
MVQLNEIWDAISAAPPLQQQSTAQHYVGLPIDWVTRFVSVSEANVGNVGVMLEVEGVHGLRGLILSNVKIADYPQLKVLQEGNRIRIVGKISEIDVSAPTKIADAKLFFLPPSQKESV